MSEEKRVRYRLSVSPEMNARVEQLGERMSLHPQQAASMAMGMGLNILEQVSTMLEQAFRNPKLLQAMMAASQEGQEQEAEAMAAELLRQGQS